MDQGAHIPWPAVCIVGQDFPILIHLAFRRAVRYDTGSAWQGYHAVHQGISSLHDLQDHVAQTSDPEDLFLEGRVLSVGVL